MVELVKAEDGSFHVRVPIKCNNLEKYLVTSGVTEIDALKNLIDKLLENINVN